jgi:translocator protein
LEKKEEQMKNNFRFINIITFLFTLVVNYLAVNLPLNNLTTKEVADRFNVYFVPAAYVFSIWGLIYLGLIGFIIFQSLTRNRENNHIAKVGPWFAISNLANALWLVSFQYLQFGLAMVLMILLLISLIMIFLKLGIGKSKVTAAENWLVNVPFSLYLGWITVATIANASQSLYSIKWNGFGIAPEIWLVIMLAAAVIISALMSMSRRNIPYVLVLVWAFTGIALKFPNVPMVNISSWAAAGAVLLILLFSYLSKSTIVEK